jgi:hypothetical protein
MLAGRGPGYWFDGVDDEITSTGFNVTTGDFYIAMLIKPSDVTRTTDYLINKETGGVGWGLYLNEDDLYIRIDDGTHDASGLIASSVFSDDVWAEIFVNFDRSGNATAYINGKSVGTVDISSVTDTLTNAGVLHIGNDSAGGNEFKGEIGYHHAGNLTIPDVDRIAIENGGPIPFKYQGASQTEQTSGTLTVGKAYRIKDFIVGDDFTNVGGTNEDGNEFVATGTTPTTWTNSSILVQIGCVLNLDPSGFGHNTALDTSGNELHGTVNGASLINIHADHSEKTIKKTITGDTLWTDIIPAGYMLESIVFEETAGNTATLDLGTTDGGNDVFTGQTITASDITTIVINKVFSMTDDTDLDLNDDQPSSSWNSASVDVTMMMRRIA